MKLKLIIPILILAFPAYTVARHFVLKHYQWQAFYKLEEEVLAEVTSNDFLERVLGIGPEYSRADAIELFGFGDKVPIKWPTPTALFAFIENIRPQSEQEFDVVTPLGGEFVGDPDLPVKYYKYRVTVCGDRFCPFEKSKLQLVRPDGESPAWKTEAIGDTFIRSVDGFDFQVGWGASIRSEQKLVSLAAAISIEAVSWIDRVSGQLTQKSAPNYWRGFRVYKKNYVMDWEAFRGE